MNRTASLILYICFLILQPCLLQIVEAEGLIKIGYFQNDPLVFKNRKGDPEGLYIDLINKIAENENWDVRYVFGNWNECLQRLKNNEIDLMTSIARTPEREKEMQFSQENVLTIWGQVYTKKAKTIENVLDLEGQSVAFLKNGINGLYFKNMINAFDIDCRLIPADSYEDAVKYVADGLASACVVNNTHGRLLHKKYKLYATPIMFNPFKLVFATSKNFSQAHLFDKIDSAIKEWKKEDQSFYYERVSFWYGEREHSEIIVPQWILLSLLASVLVIVVSFAWIRSLSLQIRKRKKAQQELADSQRRLAEIIEFLPDPTWVIDVQGKVVAWNKAIEEMTKVSQKDMLGKGDYEYSLPFYGEKRPLLIDLVIKRDKNSKKDYLDFEAKDDILYGSVTYTLGKGKNKRYLAGTAGKLYNSDGQVVGAIETLREVTEEKRLEIEREHLIVDLKNAINQIKTLSGLLPICASCKKIRDDKGYWNQIETYIERHTEALFSHGMCPACEKKMYGHQEWYKKMQKKKQK